MTALVGGLVTALSVIFSLTITGVQTVHQQYPPRLLQNFVRDRGTKITLGVFAGTVASMLAVLRSLPPSASACFPGVAVLGGMVRFTACAGVVAYFAQHITNVIRVHDATQRVETETRTALDRALRTAELGVTHDGARQELPDVPHHAGTVAAERTGYLQDVDLGVPAAPAIREGASIRMQPGVGDLVVAGTALAHVWSPSGRLPRRRLRSTSSSTSPCVPCRRRSTTRTRPVRRSTTWRCCCASCRAAACCATSRSSDRTGRWSQCRPLD